MIKFELINDSQELDLKLINDNEEIKFDMTDYNDKEVRELIDNVDNKIDNLSTYTNEELDKINDEIENIENDYALKSEIPTQLKQLSEDSTHRTVTDIQITNWNNKQEQLISGTNIKTINNNSILGSGNIEIESGGSDYSALTNKPKINNVELNGNKTSSDLGLQPAGNYVTNTYYASTSRAGLVKINNNFGTAMVGDMISGASRDYETYTSDSVNLIVSKGTLENVIEGKGLYEKPTDGIPATDLADEVQTSLGKADTAIQSLTPAILKDGGASTQTVSLTSGSGTTALAVKSRATSSYISFSNNNAWLASYGVSSDKKPTFYNGSSYTLAYTSDVDIKQNITDNTLTTTNKTIPTAINEVNSIAKGANQAIGYSDYQTMITAINSLSADKYKVGQNVYIVTVNVPDLWVSNVESTSSTYTYVDDATVINDLETNGYIQVGYYKLSMLETQKVDLTNYITNTDYATSSSAGIIRVGTAMATYLNSDNRLSASTKTYADYTSSSDAMFIGKGTLENVIAGKGLVSNTDYATTTTAGVMNYPDKIKLDNISGYYGTSSTGATTSAKVVVCDNFVLEEGAVIYVKFTNANTYNGTATLNVNSTGAKSITRVGTTTTTRYYWSAGEVVGFVYDGTNYVMIERGTATTTYYGITKLYTGAGSDSQALALTPRSLYYLANYSIAPYYSTSATYAVGDKVRYTYYIYECITAIETPEAWTASHWQQLDTIQEQIDNLSTTIGDIETLLSEV